VPELYRWRTPVVENEFNSLGFRDKEHQTVKPANTRRIIILGDSIVYGQMVDFEQIFPQVLEKILNEQLTAVNYEVISIARAGWNTQIQLEALMEKGIALDPDLIIVAFVLNDTQIKRNPLPEEDFDQERAIIPFKKVDKYLDRESFLYSFIKFRYNRLLEKVGIKTDYFSHQRTFYNPDFRGWKQFVNALEQINSISRENEAENLFISLNWRPIWEKEAAMALSQAQKLSMPAIDMYPFFKHQSPDNWQVSPSDWHPNAKAHAIYAQAIADYIVANIW
jgi:lysophospholipase L1-like esterase